MDKIRLFWTGCLSVLFTNKQGKKKFTFFSSEGASRTERYQVFVFTYMFLLVGGRLSHCFGRANILFRKGRQASKLKGWCLNKCLITLTNCDCNTAIFEEGHQEPNHTGKHTAGLGTQYKVSWKSLKQQLPKEKSEAMGEWGCFCREDHNSFPGVRAEPLQG